MVRPKNNCSWGVFFITIEGKKKVFMTTFTTSREINASIEDVFAAFQPERLAKWWGPAGFTNTFALCEFKTGGKWSFVMHGPDGKNYQNENVFAEVTAPSKVVIDHVVHPIFRLTIELKPSSGGTTVFWEQVLESAEVAEAVKGIVIPANEQNLDRLTAEVLK